MILLDFVITCFVNKDYDFTKRKYKSDIAKEQILKIKY